MNKKIINIGIHILLFLVFLALPYFFSHQEFSIWDELKVNPNERSKLLSYLLMYLFFYLNFHVLIPKLYFTKKYIIFFSLPIIAFVGITVFSKSINWFERPPLPPQLEHRPMPRMPIDDNETRKFPPMYYGGEVHMREKPPQFGFELTQGVLVFLIGFFLSLLVRINMKWRESENEKLNAELSNLKMQINPHFMFNVMNTVYASAIDENAGETAATVAKTADLMRYVMSNKEDIVVPLGKEIDYIKNYIDLQKMRFGNTADIRFELEGSFQGLSIAPMILINFIENAFKYGISNEVVSPIYLKISILNNKINFNIFNKKLNKINIESNQLGLNNTRKRLDLLYPNNYKLIIHDENDDFEVNLEINLI